MRTVTALGLVLSLVVAASTPALAEEPTIEVRTLHERGMIRFEAGDYEAALIAWKRAFVVLPYTDHELRPALVADIVEAHTRAYDVGRNPEHLVEAMRVVDLRKNEIEQFHAAGSDETTRLDAQRTELARLHELALSEGEQPTTLPTGVALRIEAPPPPMPTRKQIEGSLAADHELGREFRQAKSMADAGFVLLMVGVGVAAGAILTTMTMYTPPEQRDDGDLALAPVVIPLGSVAFVTATVGGTLLGVGRKRKKRIEDAYEDRPSMAVPMPLAFPHGGGIGFAGRF